MKPQTLAGEVLQALQLEGRSWATGLSQSGPGVLIGPGKSKVSVSTAVNPLDSGSVGSGRLWARLEPHCPESSVATSLD